MKREGMVEGEGWGVRVEGQGFWEGIVWLKGRVG